MASANDTAIHLSQEHYSLQAPDVKVTASRMEESSYAEESNYVYESGYEERNSYAEESQHRVERSEEVSDDQAKAAASETDDAEFKAEVRDVETATSSAFAGEAHKGAQEESAVVAKEESLPSDAQALYKGAEQEMAQEGVASSRVHQDSLQALGQQTEVQAQVEKARDAVQVAATHQHEHAVAQVTAASDAQRAAAAAHAAEELSREAVEKLHAEEAERAVADEEVAQAEAELATAESVAAAGVASAATAELTAVSGRLHEAKQVFKQRTKEATAAKKHATHAASMHKKAVAKAEKSAAEHTAALGEAGRLEGVISAAEIASKSAVGAAEALSSELSAAEAAVATASANATQTAAAAAAAAHFCDQKRQAAYPEELKASKTATHAPHGSGRNIEAGGGDAKTPKSHSGSQVNEGKQVKRPGKRTRCSDKSAIPGSVGEEHPQDKKKRGR